jgi:hypothetical protein
MSIGETRNLILGLTPDEAVLQLADKIDSSRILNETKLSEFQSTIDAQQVKLAEQQKLIEKQTISLKNTENIANTALEEQRAEVKSHTASDEKKAEILKEKSNGEKELMEMKKRGGLYTDD